MFKPSRPISSKPNWISEQVELSSERNAKIVLHKVSASASAVQQTAHIILAHGTLSNHRTCGGLARYLSEKGYTCWLIDFEGHGNSDQIQPQLNFENMFLSGARVALEYVLTHSGEKVHWIGHSGGGLAALMLIARQPDTCTNLLSLTTLGSQACDAGKPISRKVSLWAFTLLSWLLTTVPGKAMGLGPENEPSTVMRQWYHWNLHAQWSGADGFDYTAALQNHTALANLPVYALAGTGDWFIAPVAACHTLFSLLPSKNKQWQECGIGFSFEEDYSHARLVSSRAAAREIWPSISAWLTLHK